MGQDTWWLRAGGWGPCWAHDWRVLFHRLAKSAVYFPCTQRMISPMKTLTTSNCLTSSSKAIYLDAFMNMYGMHLLLASTLIPHTNCTLESLNLLEYPKKGMTAVWTAAAPLQEPSVKPAFARTAMNNAVMNVVIVAKSFGIFLLLPVSSLSSAIGKSLDWCSTMRNMRARMASCPMSSMACTTANFRAARLLSMAFATATVFLTASMMWHWELWLMGSKYSNDNVVARNLAGRYSPSTLICLRLFEPIFLTSSPLRLFLAPKHRSISIHTSGHLLMKRSSLPPLGSKQQMPSTITHLFSGSIQSLVTVICQQSNTVCASRVTMAYGPVVHVRSRLFGIPQSCTLPTTFLYDNPIARTKM